MMDDSNYSNDDINGHDAVVMVTIVGDEYTSSLQVVQILLPCAACGILHSITAVKVNLSILPTDVCTLHFDHICHVEVNHINLLEF